MKWYGCFEFGTRKIDGGLWYSFDPRQWELEFHLSRNQFALSLLFVGVSVWL